MERKATDSRWGASLAGALLGGVVVAGTLALRASTVLAADAVACSRADVVVDVTWDTDRAAAASGVVVRLRYPSSVVLPNDADGASAKGRVELLGAATGGLFDAVNKDTDADGRDDLVSVGQITQGIASGPFARLRFDCRAGAAAPLASDFGCSADVADPAGSIPSTCTVSLTVK